MNLMDSLGKFTGGGTDFELALNDALSILKSS